MFINKDSVKNITKNFVENEFFCKHPEKYIDFDFHYLKDEIPAVMQFVRDWADVPVFITSTYRTKKYQKRLFRLRKSKTLNSKHLKGIAVDFVIDSKVRWLDLKVAIENRSGIFKSIRAMGIAGFGIYNGNRFHFDFRKDSEMYSDNYGLFNVWDRSSKETYRGIIAIAFVTLIGYISKKIVSKKK